jgi:hypothetical protein
MKNKFIITSQILDKKFKEEKSERLISFAWEAVQIALDKMVDEMVSKSLNKYRWWLSGGINQDDCIAAYQPSKWTNLNNPGVNEVKILGVWDRVLTDKEVEAIAKMSEEDIIDLLNDTQPIRVDEAESNPDSGLINQQSETDEVGAWDLDEWSVESE